MNGHVENINIENFDPESVYLGERGQNFERFIRSTLSLGMSDEYIPYLTTKESLNTYDIAFTSRGADDQNNYEMFEQLGDVSVNKFIVNYMYKRFPQLRNPNGVDVVAKLKIKYASKNQLQMLSEKLGMWNFITATYDERTNKKKPLLEDAFESFFGATEWLIDSFIDNTALRQAKQGGKVTTYVGVGYNIIYAILTSLFNDINISLKYEDLVDAKTRFNEVIAEQKSTIGDVKYEDVYDHGKHTSRIYRYPPGGKGGKELLGTGTGTLKRDAQEHAAGKALETLARKHNIIKEAPDRFKAFA
jgi:dsRNA-specific ribonuclease